jgi:hypothetical protein
MAVTVVDQANYQEFLDKGTVPPFKEPEKAKVEGETKAEGEPDEKDKVDEDGLTADERAKLGAKLDKIVGKRHKAMKQAQEEAADAESFARTEYARAQLAEERAAALEARLKELESKTAPKTEEAKEPKPEDFKDGVEYARALAKYESAKAVEDYRKEQADKLRSDTEAAQRKALGLRNEAFAKTVDDFEEVVKSLGEMDARVPDFIQEWIMESKGSSAVMYHFGKNHEALQDILEMKPIMAIDALAKLEKDLNKPKTDDKADEKADKKDDTKALSRAPAPITPIAATNGTVHKEVRDMTTREVIEYEERLERHKATRRQRH